MACKVSDGGTYRLDRVFTGVGRIAKASGATTLREFRKRDALLTRLYDQGRLDLLNAIRAGTITVTEVYAAARADQLDTLTGDRKALMTRLWDAVTQWVPRSARGAATRHRYGTSFTALKRRAILPASATVSDLQIVDWKELETTWGGSAADWNHLRRAISKFLSDTLGDVHHPVRRAIMKAFPRRAERARVPDLSPALFWQILHVAPEHIRPAFIVMAATGLRVGEYLRLDKSHLKPATHSLDVPGTKTASSAATLRVDERLWPWLEAAVPAPVQYKWLRLYWKRALAAAGADTSLRLHDLRHACAQWLVDAGRPEASVQQTMRHTTSAMTRRYATQRDRGEDAQTMATLLLKAG